MKLTEIKELLARYYDGISTLDEEKTLLAYFSSTEVPDHLLAERDIFLLLVKESEGYLPAVGLEDRMAAQLFHRNRIHKRLKNRLIYGVILSSAASILIAVSFWLKADLQGEPDDTFDSPELAYAETMKVLNQVSTHFILAVRALQPLESISVAKNSTLILEESSRLFNQGYEEMEKLENGLNEREITNK